MTVKELRKLLSGVSGDTRVQIGFLEYADGDEHDVITDVDSITHDEVEKTFTLEEESC